MHRSCRSGHIGLDTSILSCVESLRAASREADCADLMRTDLVEETAAPLASVIALAGIDTDLTVKGLPSYVRDEFDAYR